MSLDNLPLILLGILAVASGCGLIFSRNPLYAILLLVLNFFAIAGMYLTLHAEFLFAIQIIVYAGAIMVLFLFVVMLLNLDESHMEPFRWDSRRLGAMGLGLVLLFQLLYALNKGLPALNGSSNPNFAYGKVEAIGHELMTNYVFPFEMISVVLLAALIGAVVIAKRHN